MHANGDMVMTVVMVKLRQPRTLARKKNSVAMVRGKHEGLREHHEPHARRKAKWSWTGMSTGTGRRAETAHEAEVQTEVEMTVGYPAAAGVEGGACPRAQSILASQGESASLLMTTRLEMKQNTASLYRGEE